MWTDGIGWHWLGTLAMLLFWALIIVLALAPIKYLRSESRAPELRAIAEGDFLDTEQGRFPPTEQHS
ncbi:hypothetical protein GCM10027343_14530 [Noviherbaspirillum agri]